LHEGQKKETMKTLMIDDEPELKAYDKHYDLTQMDVAKTVEEGIEYLQNFDYDRLLLDYELGPKKGTEILMWLSDHLDRVPKEIFSISFVGRPVFQNMIQSLLIEKAKTKT